MCKLLDDNIYYIIYVSFVQSCFLISSVNFFSCIIEHNNIMLTGRLYL